MNRNHIDEKFNRMLNDVDYIRLCVYANKKNERELVKQ